MKKSSLISGILIACIAIIILGIWWWIRSDQAGLQNVETSLVNLLNTEQVASDVPDELQFAFPVVNSLPVSGDFQVPLTNGYGLGMSDVPVTLHYAQGAVTVTRWEENGPQPQVIAQGGAGGTLAVYGQHVMVSWVDTASRNIRAVWSFDGGRTFESSTALAQLGRGAATPSACINKAGQAWLAWTNMEEVQGNGQLMLAIWNGSHWLPVVDTGFGGTTAATLTCDGEITYLAWRDQSKQRLSSVPVMQVNLKGELTPVTTLENAYDPTITACQGEIWLGYHDVTGATWRARVNGESILLDEDAKFVSSACLENRFAWAWADYPDKAAAQQPTTPTAQATRKLPVVVQQAAQMVTLDPASGKGDSGPASLAFGPDGSLYVAWRTTGLLYLAEFPSI